MVSSPTCAAVSVFVRVRPLTPPELQKGATELPGLRLSSTEPTEPDATVYDDTSGGCSSAIGGFTGLIGCTASNCAVFERCFEPQLQAVTRGGVASLFCYGYTGSGKTHSVIGYGDEQGLYFLAAERLLQHLAGAGQGLFLQASVCELYNDEVFDLLGLDKVSCALRIDEDGQLQIIGKQSSVPLPASETAALEELLSAEQSQELFATMITRASGLREASVFHVEDLQEVSRSCVQQRAAGSSTEHAQSSRSHCIIRMDVVNEALLKAQVVVDEAKAVIPPRKNAVDNVMVCRFKLLWENISHGLFPVSAPVDKSDYHVLYPESGFYDPNDGFEIDLSAGMVNGLVRVKGHEADGAKSIADWAKHFGVPELVFGLTRSKILYAEPGRWEALKEILDLKMEAMWNLLRRANDDFVQAVKTLEEIKAGGPTALGGRLLLVDLAGADYDHRAGKEQKETANINKSLLSLKECFRSLANVSQTRAKFRNSKLTRLLEDSLAPSACSRRRNGESTSVMLVNISPAEHLRKMTLNTLRYGQLFAAAERPHKGCAHTPSQKQVATASQEKPVRAQCDPKIREAIFALYGEHCPEKSEHDIEVILKRFQGKEAELLEKARGKYCSQVNQ
uniref:Kinesin motor domain-containing protein n=1 Tax=Zooxanthella nutricula TaxID=1333877 RepID=A0A7S2PDE3_9DINO